MLVGSLNPPTVIRNLINVYHTVKSLKKLFVPVMRNNNPCCFFMRKNKSVYNSRIFRVQTCCGFVKD